MRTILLAGAVIAASLVNRTPASAALPQTCTPAQTSAFATVAFLVGDWTGTGNAEGANGSGGDSFHFELGCHVLVRHAHSSYVGASGAPASTYEGLMVIYPDATASGGLRADSFDSGGHAIHYVLVGGTQPNVAQFLSDGSTAQPTFRLTYTRHAIDLEVTFEMAPPGSASFMTIAHGTDRAT
jgi:hypothetical protein